jgi:L-threonylcarbamoyladenylate synthase
MDSIERATAVLMHDGIVVYPTETVYGLGADALSETAILRVYEAKRRPLGQPISIAVSDFDMLAAVAHVDGSMQKFIEAFLPGPVTVVLRAKHILPAILTGGTGLIGVRIPSHALAVRLIERFDSPITATSANLHGAMDPATPDECSVPRDFLIDGGRLPGTPSTVVDLVNRTILRRGVRAEQVEHLLGSL